MKTAEGISLNELTHMQAHFFSGSARQRLAGSTEPILHAMTTISIAQSVCTYSLMKSLSTRNIFKLQTGW
jgi:hypothetical protein